VWEKSVSGALGQKVVCMRSVVCQSVLGALCEREVCVRVLCVSLW
jgi:hypothetical protein